MKILIVYLFSALLLASNSFATRQVDKIKENHNLIVIQKISRDKKSFVIRRGQQQKIYVGQRSMFSSRDVSIVAKVIASNNLFSQWEVIDEQAVVPFDMGEIVTISYSIERVWSEIPKLISDENYKTMLAEEELKIKKKYVRVVEDRFQMMAGFTKGINESTTESENNDGTRDGTSFKMRYLPAINELFRWEIALRYDQDLLKLYAPTLEISSKRYMASLGMQTRFTDLTAIDAIPYLSLSLGYGTTSSELNDEIRTGKVMALPTLALGLDFLISRNVSMLVEASLESLTIEETLPDGTLQSTNMTNGMLSVGFEFK
jgi:hypothetical protein